MTKYIAIYLSLVCVTWWAGENIEDVKTVFNALTGYGDDGWVLYLILPLIVTLIIALKSWRNEGFGADGGGDFFDGGFGGDGGSD